MPLKIGKAKPIICRNKEICFIWRGPAVVVDVLRFSTTVCSLVSIGKKSIRLYEDKEEAVKYKDKTPNLEFFSELEFEPPFDKFDNSPYHALVMSDPAKPALVITTAGTKAVFSLKNASDVFIGCFANFSAVIKYMNNISQEIIIVPAGLFNVHHIEDFACAHAMLKYFFGASNAALLAIDNLKKSERQNEFLKTRPTTGRQDLQIAFVMDKFNVLPFATLKSNYAEIGNIIAK